MATIRQTEANRKNARRSTGPRTRVGKATVALNALRHGAYASVAVLPTVENDAEWNTHREGIVQSLRPIGILEHRLAERVASILWRLRRVERFESASILSAMAELELPVQTQHSSSFATQQAVEHSQTKIGMIESALRLLGEVDASDINGPVSVDVAEYLLDCASQVLVNRPKSGQTNHPDLQSCAGWTREKVTAAIVALAEGMLESKVTGEQLLGLITEKLRTFHAVESDAAQYFADHQATAESQRQLANDRALADRIFHPKQSPIVSNVMKHI